MAAESMTDFDYDPIPLDPPEVLAPEAILDGALAYQDLLARRRTVRRFASWSRYAVAASNITVGVNLSEGSRGIGS